MGDIGFTDKNHGLAYLVAVVVEVAHQQLTEANPEVAARISACHDPDEAARLAGEAGLTNEAAVKVLNEALALEMALDRLTNALAVASLDARFRSTAVSRLAEDGLYIALSAVVDSTKRTLEAALSSFVGEDDETRTLRVGWRTWTKELKQQLGKVREPVAHGEPFHLAQFGELKIWEGSILLGVGGYELFRSMLDDRLSSDHEALERRVVPLRQMAVLLIAKVFAEAGAVAALLERRCVRPV